MYLSKVKLLPPIAYRPYHFHKELWKVFPEDKNLKRDFLFRVERRTRTEGLDILLQSKRPPDRNSKFCIVLATKDYQINVKEGDRLLFKLMANPTKKMHDPKKPANERGNENGKRVPLMADTDLDDWITNKLSPVSDIIEVEHRFVQDLFFLKGRRGGKINLTCFEGQLKVTNVEGFLKMVSDGIGPAKAFGCGMLSLARG